MCQIYLHSHVINISGNSRIQLYLLSVTEISTYNCYLIIPLFSCYMYNLFFNIIQYSHIRSVDFCPSLPLCAIAMFYLIYQSLKYPLRTFYQVSAGNIPDGWENLDYNLISIQFIRYCDVYRYFCSYLVLFNHVSVFVFCTYFMWPKSLDLFRFQGVHYILLNNIQDC